MAPFQSDGGQADDAREADRATAFVPIRLAAKLRGEGDAEVRFDGTVLVADIAGYAQLTERFSAQGEDGIERLSGVLSAVFEKALGIIEAHGGEVVFFAGDALICYWEADDAADPTARAAACGRALIAATGAGMADLGLALPFHVSVVAGPLWAARVGGWSGRWDLLFGGPAVRAAFAGLKKAGAGQIEIGVVPTEAPADDVVGHAAEGVSHGALLPATVERRAEADGAWTTDIRHVDCLFVKIPDLDETRAGELARFRRAMFIVHDTLKTASATGRLVIDDGGLTIVWVMGEPAGERGRALDSPIEMAATLTARLRHAGFVASAGMASGRAFCASFGTARRREVVAVGAPMVLAARLMDHARGTLLVAGTPARRPGSGFETSALAPLVVKGFARPVPVTSVEASAEQDAVEALVGRTEPLRALDERLDALAAGTGGLCFVTGPAGAGKSSLTRALEARARRRGISLSIGESHGAERSVPYFAWRSIFRSVFSDLALDDPDALEAALARHLVTAGKDPAYLPLLGPIFPLRRARQDATREIVGDDRAAATRDLLLALLESRLPAAQVLVLEDLHDMDSTSLGLADAAVRRFPGVLFVVTSRMPCTSTIAQRLHDVAAPVIDLGPLDAGDVTQLAGAVFGLRLSPAASAEICGKASGIPLYVSAYLRQAQELARAAPSAAPLADLPPGIADLRAEPDPVRGVLGRFFDGLSAVDGRIIKVASVVGERFTTDLLAETLETPVARDDLKAVLRGMSRHGVLRSEAGEPDDHHFAHALIQRACYETIPSRQRRDLHERVAAALGRRLGGDEEGAPDDLIVALAHHHDAAGDHARVVHFAERAALRSRRQGAYREALRWLDRCLDSASRLPSSEQHLEGRVRWLRLKSEAAGAIGDRDGRRRDAELAISLASPRAARGRWARIGFSVFQLLASASRRRDLVPPRAGPPRITDLELAQIYKQLAIGAYFAGQSLEIAFNATSALTHARRAGRSPELSDSLASMGTFLGIVGFVQAGRRHLRAAVALSTELQSDPAIIYAHLSSALFLMGLGEWDDVTRNIEQCQKTCQRTGNLGDWANAQALRFWVHHYRGDPVGAARAAEVLHEAATKADNPQHQSWAARFRALCLGRREEWTLAKAELEAARSLFVIASENKRQVRPLYELVPVLGDLASARFQLGERREARELLTNTLHSFLQTKRPAGHAVLEGYESLARVAFAVMEGGGALEDLSRVRQIVELLQRYSRVFPIGRPQLSYWTGRLASRRGHHRAARSIWQRGLASARQLGMAHEAERLARALA